MVVSSSIRAVFLLASLAVLTSCTATSPVNPSFRLSMEEAEQALEDMEEDPVPLERPLVFLGGFLDPGLGGWWISGYIDDVISNREQILSVSFFTACSFEECRERVIEAVDEAFPSDDPVWTTEVDVVGISLGGLVARDAAAPPAPTSDATRRLRIGRLFSLSVPHRGANLAGIPLLHPLQYDMRYGSELTERLDRELRALDYEIVPYVRLGDFLVGSENAAPPGMHPYWVSNGMFNLAHIGGCTDKRILADIARRLRGEAPYTDPDATPIP